MILDTTRAIPLFADVNTGVVDVSLRFPILNIIELVVKSCVGRGVVFALFTLNL